MICFDQVLLDCHGNPDLSGVAYYYLLVLIINQVGWYSCPLGEDPGRMCPLYDYGEWTEMPLRAGEDGSPRYCLPMLAENPGVGDIQVYRPVAVDGAGNHSWQECPP